MSYTKLVYLSENKVKKKSFPKMHDGPSLRMTKNLRLNKYC